MTLDGMVCGHLLRLTVAGMRYGDALALLEQAQPPGETRAAISAARRSLEAGAPKRGGLGPQAALLIEAASRPELLEMHAAAAEADATLDGLRRALRVHGSLAIAGPLLGGSLMAWATPRDLYGQALQEQMGPVRVEALLQWLGVPGALLVTGLVVLLTRRQLPGGDALATAVALVRASPADTRLPEHAARFLQVRREQVGADRARRDLARHLLALGCRQAAFARAAAPVAGAVLAGWLLLALLGPWLIVPLFQTASAIGG